MTLLREAAKNVMSKQWQDSKLIPNALEKQTVSSETPETTISDDLMTIAPTKTNETITTETFVSDELLNSVIKEEEMDMDIDVESDGEQEGNQQPDHGIVHFFFCFSIL